ncbi:hypothetical protein Agub_g12936, partial [Astrephomene gubernaculifera]
PASPAPPESDDDEEPPAWPSELSSLLTARRLQQQQLLQQQQQGPGQMSGLQQLSQTQGSLQGPPSSPASPHTPHSLFETLQASRPEAASPVWLFPGVSRPVTGETVATALAWVNDLLADPGKLVAWAQPISRIHELMVELSWTPKAPGCRRAAVLLCQRLPAREPTQSEGILPFITPAGTAAPSRAVSRAISRNVSRAASRRIRSRAVSRNNTLGRAGTAAGTTSGGSGAGGGGVRVPSRLSVAGVEGEETLGRLSPSSPIGLRQTSSITLGAEPHVAFGEAATGAPASVAAAAGTAAVSSSSPPPSPAALTPEATFGETAAAAVLGGGGSDGTIRAPEESALLLSPAAPEHRPRSSLTRSGQGRSGGAGGGGAAAAAAAGLTGNNSSTDGVRWSYSVASRRPAAESAAQSDSDLEGQPRSRTSPQSRSNDGVAPGAEEEDEEWSTVAGPEPPDLGFPIFVVVHELPPLPTTSFPPGSPAAAAVNGPNYLLACHLYQKHLEGLMYEQAREEMEQLPMSYFERLADMYGGFTQVVESPSEIGAALVLATSCAVSGRYLRQLRLVARGSLLRDQHPAKLPPALPLGEPLSLLVRLSRMQPGAALVLHGVWPSGKPAHVEVSVDPRSRTAGQLLTVLCALSEVSELFNELPPLGKPRNGREHNPAANAALIAALAAAASSNAANGTNGPTGHHGHHGTHHHHGPGHHGHHHHGRQSQSNSQLQLVAPAAAAFAAAWASSKQLAARKRATQRSLAFNLVTPFTAMALISMTLSGNRGLIVHTLQTTTSRPSDYRQGHFMWPAPIMAVMAAAAKEAAAAAAQLVAAAAAANGAASGAPNDPKQPGATSSGGAAAAGLGSTTASGALSTKTSQQLQLTAPQQQQPYEFSAELAAAMAMMAGGGGGGGVAALTPPVVAPPPPPPPASSARERYRLHPHGGKEQADAAEPPPLPPQPPEAAILAALVRAVISSEGEGSGSEASDPQQLQQQQQQQQTQLGSPLLAGSRRGSGRAGSSRSGSARRRRMLLELSGMLVAVQQGSAASAQQAASGRASSAEPHDLHPGSSTTATGAAAGAAAVPAGVLHLNRTDGASSTTPPAAPSPPPSPAMRTSFTQAPPPPAIRPVSRLHSAPLPQHPHQQHPHPSPGRGRETPTPQVQDSSPLTASSGLPLPPLPPLPPQPSLPSSSKPLSYHPSQPAPPLPPSGSLQSPPLPSAPSPQPPGPPSPPLEAIKALQGPIGPPLTATSLATAHLLTVIGRLSMLQQADGSWPAVAEVEELVVSNGRHLVVPVLGGPKPATPAEKMAADAREARLRESLTQLRETALRGAVRGPAWSTVLALALLRGKYGSHRMAWIPLEAKAFAWLERKWPPPAACGISPPAAIMRVSALL